jgi:hypothetical protein
MITGGYNGSLMFGTAPTFLSHLILTVLTPGITLEYEYMLNKNFSLGIGIGTLMYFIPYQEIIGRWYPWAKMFYMEISLGIYAIYPFMVSDPFVFYISPEIGWKINIGKKNRWALIPSLGGQVLWLEDGSSTFVTETGLKLGYKF